MTGKIRGYLVALFLFAGYGVSAAPALASGPQLSVAPVSPRFAAFVASRERTAKPVAPGAAPLRALGYIPSPVDYSYLKGKGVAAQPASKSVYLTATLPASFDLRQQQKLTPVRDQGGCGACWAFSAVGAVESALMPAEPRHFSENNLKNQSGFDTDACAGGNGDMATAYFGRWAGPVNNADDPYSETSTLSPSSVPTQKHVQETILIPPRNGLIDNDAIKRAIVDYGGVMSAIYVDDGIRASQTSAYYNRDSYAYDNTDHKDTNHIIVIVGWDDNFDKGKFSPLSTQPPPGNGAFIARNSWGSGFGDGGYFYISYYDVAIGLDNYQFRSISLPFNFSRIYQYDPLGKTGATGYKNQDTAWFANIFTAQANESISAAAFHTASAGSSYQIYLYTGISAGNPTNGVLAATQSGTIAEPGYHTVPFSPTAVTSGQKFSVVVRLTTPGSNFPVAMESPVQYYASPVASTGESFISPDGASWQDLTTSQPNANVCLKAFASNPSFDSDSGAPVVSSFSLPAASNSLTVPVLGFDARDDQLVTGYLITESADIPSWFAAGWSATKPASFQASGQGVKTYYAWVKDAVGNVSAVTTASVAIDVNQLVTVRSLSSFWKHTVMVKSDGTLWGWGANGSGQLGDGTLTDRKEPVRIGTDSDWREVAAGGYHSLAIKTDGSLWAWGNNQYGQLGNGAASYSNVPLRVGTANDWLHVAAGHFHSLAVKADGSGANQGSLWGWGDNSYGQLGSGNLANAGAPLRVGTGANWQQVSAGYYHSVALQADGSLFSWGDNYNGQLGDGTVVNQAAPVAVLAGSFWSKVAANGFFTVGIKRDGTLWSWGSDYYRQLGQGTGYDQKVPGQIGQESDWKDVSAGRGHAAAVKNDGSLWSWGDDSYGQLGDGGSATVSLPARVGTAGDWQGVFLGENFSSALKSDGSLWSWGDNANGEIGNGGGGESGPEGVRVNAPALVLATLPRVTAFSLPAESYNLLVPITMVSGADNVAVAGYCVAESASPSGCNWSASVPASHLFGGTGGKTLYAFVRDAAGNVSSPGSAAVSIYRPGDCDQSGAVTVAETKSAIGILLGQKQPGACLDLDGSGLLSVAELQKVINGLSGL